MTRKAYLFICLLAMLVSFGAIAQAPADSEGRERIMSELKPYKHKFFEKELKLTKEQARDFLPLYDKMEAELQQINDETRELEKRVVDNDKASDTEIEAASRAIFMQKQREAELEMQYYEKFKEILTPRQLLKLKSVEREFTRSLMRHHRKLSRDKK